MKAYAVSELREALEFEDNFKKIGVYLHPFSKIIYAMLGPEHRNSVILDPGGLQISDFWPGSSRNQWFWPAGGAQEGPLPWGKRGGPGGQGLSWGQLISADFMVSISH